ncbi:unnamed protein product [Rotaria sp. Silwood1]|nr:unnamed protein product [Rotaria sp. Silwood1]
MYEKEDNNWKFKPKCNRNTLGNLAKKVTNVQNSLSKDLYQPEVDYAIEKIQFNILIVGSPRVGKSELINALCNGKCRAETSSSLNSCTKEVRCYVLEDDRQHKSDEQPFKINFYDTPGIESWINQSGKKTMLEFIEEKNPVCLIYCASPGSFADLKQVHPVLEFCKSKDIFCALVCTNMWSGSNRHMVIKEFEKELQFFGEQIDKFADQSPSQTHHKVSFFGKGALCTMVNSKEYHDPDLSDKRMPVQGIDELIHSIMESLDQEKLLAWCYAVLHRRTYWEKINNIFLATSMAKEYSIVVCGSARVGKSTLVNAICGKQVARTSSSLCSHTERMEKYIINRNDIFTNDRDNSVRYTITIYDTPGIESWTEEHVRSYLSNIMQTSKPVCMIYCASPGSFARLDQLQWLVNTCIQSNIFCALVCTNKYSGGHEKRTQVMQDFHSLLTRYHGMTRDENMIKYYGDVALCTAVNSIVYEDRDLCVRKEAEGINELIFGILTSLKDDKIVAWCYTVADNESFWTKMGSKLTEFFKISQPVVEKFFQEHGKEIATALFGLIMTVIKRKM